MKVFLSLDSAVSQNLNIVKFNFYSNLITRLKIRCEIETQQFKKKKKKPQANRNVTKEELSRFAGDVMLPLSTAKEQGLFVNCKSPGEIGVSIEK
jgi:hypothetical protein